MTKLGKWKCAFDKDLSKTFDCLSHRQRNAKLIAYGFTLATLKLIPSYLSILGPILFSILSNHLFLVMNDVNFVSYGDDSTTYDSVANINSILISLRESEKRIFKWL